MIELLEHNVETYQNLCKEMEKHNKVALIQATGTGKSYIISKYIEEHCHNALILVPANAIGETLMFRQSLGVKNRGLDKCFACGYKFGSEEKPYLGLIKNHSNQFICRECAMKVNPERVRYSEEN